MSTKEGIFNGCDVKAEKNGVVIAVEVETGKSKTWDHLIKNIERDNWADRIVILCPNRDVRGRIEKEIAGKNIGKLIVISYDFIENLADLLPE